ncbi:MAG: hypothetical protein DRH15_03440, partial [Deltaproteobacteria bacterium]
MPTTHLKKLLRSSILTDHNSLAILGQPISEQFTYPTSSTIDNLRKLNAAFLISLGGKELGLARSASEFLELCASEGILGEVRDLYLRGRSLIVKEIREASKNDPEFQKTLINTARRFERGTSALKSSRDIARLWKVFFPEGAFLCGPRKKLVAELRERRKVKITSANSNPIREPLEEILFTGNILLTVPLTEDPQTLHLVPRELAYSVLEARKDQQTYWYDHPIPIGIPKEKNEVVYGLRALNEAVAFEKKARGASPTVRLKCVLSVSVTHDRLQGIAKPIVVEMIRCAGDLAHLDIYLWTENETDSLVERVLGPAARHYMGVEAEDQLKRIIGVNGEYGRHYSFLRAISALWHVCCDHRLRATFKIDLDQVFPQEQLVAETGRSAFEHFLSPMWGAKGLDSSGQPVYLGMIAGALVNHEDAAHSLFIPDVTYPKEIPKADEIIFFSRLPQALSTEAEMMARYDRDGFDSNTCVQRIHVTGGTCGILIDALRKYRPFTPTFVARAEDQAYIMSVLFEGHNGYLRYLHKDGLIMRHDKEAFAREAIEKAWPGKFVGDLARMLVFSYYARALPWGVQRIKEQIDPFTGCFVSRIPITVAYLRLALRSAWLFGRGNANQARELLETAVARLTPLLEHLGASVNPFENAFRMEKKGWDLYY